MYRCRCRFKTFPSPYSKMGMNAGGAHFLQLYNKNKYSDSHTVEPCHREGTGKNLFPVMRFRCIKVLFHIIYFTFARVNKIVHYTQDFII